MIPAPPNWTAAASLTDDASALMLAELQRLTVDAERVRADLAAAERRGYEAGVRDTVRRYWAAVCEDEARQHDRHAGYHRWLAGTGVIQAQRHRDAAAEHEVRAAQYRTWAREGG